MSINVHRGLIVDVITLGIDGVGFSPSEETLLF